MILYPAIDLKDGQCVRLEKGDMNRATVFNDDPAAQARIFVQAGFEWLHVVDLNGAVAGRPVNTAAVAAVADAIDIPLQLGGGIRDMVTIENWLTNGVDRVVLGTAALTDPGLVREACTKFPGRVAVGIDARDGWVASRGWTETTDVSAEDLAARFADAGVAAIVHTDIERDGMLAGVNVAATAALARAVDIPVIASGGVAALADIAALAAVTAPALAGVICGRALYDGRLDPAAALSLARLQGREDEARPC